MSNWYIERENFPDQCIKLTSGKFKLGRSPTSDIVCEDMRISQNHCEIYITKNLSRGFIMDFSSNGTYINGHKLNKHGCYEISNGDRIGLAIPAGSIIPKVELDHLYSFMILKIINSVGHTSVTEDISLAKEVKDDKSNNPVTLKSPRKSVTFSLVASPKRKPTKVVTSDDKAKRSMRLKELALKEKYQKAKSPQKEKNAPLFVKVTRKNRGAFLLQSAKKNS